MLYEVITLQQAGVITGYKAEVDPRKLGVGLQAMISVSYNFV